MLSLSAREPFADEQVWTLGTVTPHLARMFVALETNVEPVGAAPPARSARRMVASR